MLTSASSGNIGNGDWNLNLDMGTGWSYYDNPTANSPDDTRIIGGEEVTPPCPECKYPFYVLVQTGGGN